MFWKNREGDEFIRHLAALTEEVYQNRMASPAKSTDEQLRQFDILLAKSKGSSISLAGRIEKLAWLLVSPLADLKIRNQIRRIQEIADTFGRDSALTRDAMQHLDNIVFARTYGRICDAPIKRIVRSIASNGAMATHELRNLVVNRCFQVDEKGLVSVPQKKWLFSLGIVQVMLATAGLLPPILIIVFSGLNVGHKMLASLIYLAPYLAALWTFHRYFLTPRKLIPRAQLLLPKLQPISLK